MSGLAIQLDLIPADPCERYFPYWREQLREWVRYVWMFRDHMDSTGWSMCCQDFSFAENLFEHGQLTPFEFYRYWKLDGLVWRRELRRRELRRREKQEQIIRAGSLKGKPLN